MGFWFLGFFLNVFKYIFPPSPARSLLQGAVRASRPHPRALAGAKQPADTPAATVVNTVLSPHHQRQAGARPLQAICSSNSLGRGKSLPPLRHMAGGGKAWGPKAHYQCQALDDQALQQVLLLSTVQLTSSGACKTKPVSTSSPSKAPLDPPFPLPSVHKGGQHLTGRTRPRSVLIHNRITTDFVF